MHKTNIFHPFSTISLSVPFEISEHNTTIKEKGKG